MKKELSDLERLIDYASGEGCTITIEGNSSDGGYNISYSESSSSFGGWLIGSAPTLKLAIAEALKHWEK